MNTSNSPPPSPPAVTTNNFPHTPLVQMQTLARQGRYETTVTALADAAALDMGVEDMVQTVLDLTMDEFYKSMSSIHNSSMWQDVYRAKTAVGVLYVKLQLNNGAVNMRIVSFKEK